MDNHYDVAIIGGGPAGSTSATLLAQKKRRVIVLEREKFPRFHIGESLLPFSMATFERLGVRKKLDDAGFIIKWGAQIASACGKSEVKFYFKDGMNPPAPTAYQVPRAEFDKILLDHSRESGVEVHEETLVQKLDFLSQHVAITTEKEGVTRQVTAKYLIDCSGRNSVVGSMLNLKRTYPGLKKFAVYAHYENVEVPEGIDGSLIRMVRSKDRWFWMIPLTTTRVSIGVVMDLEVYRAMKLSPEQMLEQSIREQPKVMERMQHAELASRVYASSDYSYRNQKLFGERWLLAGDAAGFIDPVFSSGVFLALLSGERAADTLNAVLDDETRSSDLFPKYAKVITRVMDVYLRFVQGWYRQEFAEMFFNPSDFMQLVPAINAMLAGNIGTSFAVRWRIGLFHLLVFLQRYFPISPKLSLLPGNA